MTAQLKDNFDEIVSTVVMFDGFDFNEDNFSKSICFNPNIKYHIIAPYTKANYFMNIVNEYCEDIKIEVDFVEKKDIDFEMDRIIKTSNCLLFIVMQLKYPSDITYLRDVAVLKLINKERFACITDSRYNFLSFCKFFETTCFEVNAIEYLLSLKEDHVSI